MSDGAPVLTTVIDLVQFKGLTNITGKCAALTGNALNDCLANNFEKPNALYDPFKFPEDNAIFTVDIDGKAQVAKLVEQKRWAEARKDKDEGIGTAWLIVIDAAQEMGSRFSDVQRVAMEFINRMGPNDIINIMFFNNTAVVRASDWMDKKSKALAFLKAVTGPYPGRMGRARPLFQFIKQAATDGFNGLGNVGSKVEVPMHQAMVVLSSGASGSDASSAAPVALAVRDYLTKGRFPEDNTTRPKAPVPIVSIWFPTRQLTEEFSENAKQFMLNLPNVEIGGFFSIVGDGQAESRARKIVEGVTRRFDQMHVLKWRVPCLAPKVGQTFKLVFKNTNPVILGDNFINVPVGVDPTQWPLDIDVEATVESANKDPLYPGGTVRVFGSFCWGSDFKRAEIYMLPKNQPVPESLKGRTPEEAKEAQKQLIASKMVGKATNAGESFVEFELPDSEKFLRGSGKSMTALAVIVDKETYQTSAITNDEILTLKAQKKPLNLLLIGGGVFAGVVIILLVVNMLRGGGSRRRSSRGGGGGGGAPPPVVAGGGYPPR